MSSFKENKRSAIEKAKETGDEGVRKGEQRFQELQKVKELIDGISLEDEEDAALAEGLNESYLEAGKAAFQEEVQTPIETSKQALAENKNEITGEKRNAETASERLTDMQSTTDLARSSARNVENTIKKSVEEYGDMERQTEEIEDQLTSSSQDILSRIEGLF